MKHIQGSAVTRLLIAVVMSVVSAASISHANVVTLSNVNSTATINTGGAGLTDWTVGGTDVMNLQSFWYRVGGSGAESNISTLTQTSFAQGDADFDGKKDSVNVTYTNSTQKFTVNLTIKYGTFPSSASDPKSDLQDLWTIKNVNTVNLDFHFFMFTDFDLGASDIGFLQTHGAPSDDTFTQTNALNGANALVSIPKGSDSPSGDAITNRYEISLAPGAFASLTNSTPTTLGNLGGAVTGNVSYAYEWDVVLKPGDSFTANAHVDSLVTVPEPSSFVLGLGGLLLLAVTFRRAGHAK